MAQIKKLDDGKYLIRVSKGTGKSRRYINKTFRGRLVDAKKYARDLETDLDSGRMPASRLTFNRYKTIWLAAIKPGLAPLSWDSYEGNLRRHASSLDDLLMAEIEAHHIQQIYNDLAIDRPASVRSLHASLNALFNDAVRKGIIRKNPCKNTHRPRKARSDMVVLRENDAHEFLAICREMKNGIIFEFAIETGMRPEEYLAVRWRDLNGNEVIIQQVVQFNRKGGGYYFKEPKTARGRRRIPVSDNMRHRLTVHRREQNEHRLKMKGTWFNHDLIFPDTIGNPLPIGNLTKRYLHPILEKCSFKQRTTLYSLRHTCATLLLMQGANPKTVADRLGHSSVVQTLDTYSHVLPHIQDDATAILDRVLRGNR